MIIARLNQAQPKTLLMLHVCVRSAIYATYTLLVVAPLTGVHIYLL